MLIGVPREIKNHEYRVGMTPGSVREAVSRGHRVLVERGAGGGIGACDDEYVCNGAIIADTAEEVFARAEMIVKVKEPQPIECARLRPGQILFTFLHLAPDPEQTRGLVSSGAICIAYETVTSANGALPLLAPMSEVAGRMSIQAGAACLERSHGGCGMLLGGIAGVEPARVVVLGGGFVGSNATMMAVGMGAEVVVIDRSVEVLRRLVAQFGTRITTVVATAEVIEKHVLRADLVVGGVLIPGAEAPKLVSKEMIGDMRQGAVVVDVAIDQGGCFETSCPTTHDDPTYMVDGVVHYCVANMPGAVPRTSTYALNNATLPYILRLADMGWKSALESDPHLLSGLNVCDGSVTIREVAESHGYSYVSPGKAIVRAAAGDAAKTPAPH